ncbi:MAG: MerR family transcriptional regulator [Actinobacteria bacterium]|nr:MAG: MerR family transcriptional regulator [Actinomycetota bacterium]
MPGATDADEPIGIGAFGLMTGLSVPRLRRYHEMGLLVPAAVDPGTGYRSYASHQVEVGRRIDRLRQVDLPLDDVARLILGRGNAVEVLRRHRRHLSDRITVTNRMVDHLDQLITEERLTMSTNAVQLIEIILRVDDVEKSPSTVTFSAWSSRRTTTTGPSRCITTPVAAAGTRRASSSSRSTHPTAGPRQSTSASASQTWTRHGLVH